jgi:hypothetical protein
LTAHKHLAVAPLPPEVRLVVEEVMPEEQRSKSHSTVDIKDEVHRAASLSGCTRAE